MCLMFFFPLSTITQTPNSMLGESMGKGLEKLSLLLVYPPCLLSRADSELASLFQAVEKDQFRVSGCTAGCLLYVV